MDLYLRQILSDEQVILRPLTLADAAVLFNAASDPKIWEQHPQWDRYKRPRFDDYFAGALQAPAAFVILDATTNDVIGSSRYYHVNDAERILYADTVPGIDRAICIGYTFLIPSRWGGRVNRSVKHLMIDHALKEYETILFHIGANNTRSRIATERIGATLVTRHDAAEADMASEASNVLYYIHRNDFAALQHRHAQR
jgi:RimJ/RimL family protein N-acetyltransferase